MSRFEKKRLVRLCMPLVKGYVFLLAMAMIAALGGDSTIFDLMARLR